MVVCLFSAPLPLCVFAQVGHRNNSDQSGYTSLMPKTMMRTFYILLSLALLAFPQPTWAWHDTGHKEIALIAWEDLTPAARAKAIEVLKQHPRFDKDLQHGLPDGSSEDAANRYVFAVAATWPDLVRSQSNPMHTVYSHPEWHYIDIPIVADGFTAPPAETPKGDGPHDAVQALTKNVEILRDPAASAADKAVALCWVLHLAGDIHQPLHGADFFSPDYPKGDKGGNGMTILTDPPYPNSKQNLHAYWDSLPGEFKSFQMIGYIASGVRSDPKLSREQFKDALAVKDFAAWAQESHDIAVESVYLHGTLKAAQTDKSRGSAADIPGLPPGYIEKAEQVAMTRVALAGYRTADLLNSVFDAKQ
jgi:S1/P1 Nuclease